MTKNSKTQAFWLETSHHRSSDLLMMELENEHEESNKDKDETTSDSLTSSEELKQHSLNIEKTTKRTQIVALLVIIVGAAASASFMYLGISNANSDVEENFERRASDLAKEIDGSWSDYESSALWIHESCRNWREDNFNRADFEVLYNYLLSGGLEFFAAEWVPNVTHAERAALEEEGKIGWGSVEGINYTGFVGQEPDPDNPGELIFAPRSEQPWYFPIHFGEPKKNVGNAAHYDLYSPPWERPAILRALETWEPALTGRFRLIQGDADQGYSVVLYHPGTRLPDKFHARPRDVSNMVIVIKDLLARAARFQSESMSVYLYDTTLADMDGEAAPEFLSGIEIQVPNGKHEDRNITVFPETEYEELTGARLVFEHEMHIGGRLWTVVVVPVEGTHQPKLTFIILSGSMIFTASVLLAIWMLHNMHKSIQMHRVISKAAAEASIVSNLFPAHVRERMIQDAEARNKTKPDKLKTKDVFLNNGKGGASTLSETRLNRFLTSEGIFGSKPIAELYPYTTVMFSDLVGFTAWASVREPSQVFMLLEVLYNSFDSIGQRRRVYKVETVGDTYVAVVGLPQPRNDHAVVMARFATDCCHRFQKLVKALEKTLGPDTGDLGCRFGLHSGQVVGGVLRGDKGRFQLFGDTVNMAARMESTGVRNRIQVSQETADLLAEAGRGKWLFPREDLISVKGKGKLPTFFLNVTSGSRTSSAPAEDLEVDLPGVSALRSDTTSDDKANRLIEWNVEVLSSLLKSIVARRDAMPTKKRVKGAPTKLVKQPSTGGEMVLDEVAEIITLPEFDAHTIRKQVDPETIKLDPIVVEELSCLVSKIASMYRQNPFHNFEHASHVTMSVIKMMGRIVDPNKVAAKKRQQKKDGNLEQQQKLEAALHDHTFGITSDPLTQFSCAFSALIHDLDHQGIPNMTLVAEESPLAAKYKNKSVAEQNSVDLAWELLMKPEYSNLRSCICCDEEEFARFRSLVVNSVMATDIMDKELGAARKVRWNKAFHTTTSDDGATLSRPAEDETEQMKINRKATIVIEHLIQASDVSHTMQHWHVYQKWNERLFQEMYKAYKAGRLEKDPSIGWHQGELGFFDFYIVPLAKKLFTCGVFGVSSDEFLNYALINRKEWEQKGEAMVQQYLKNFEEAFGSSSSTTPPSADACNSEVSANTMETMESLASF